MYPTWLSQELCAMLGQWVRDPSSLLPPETESDRSASLLLYWPEQKSKSDMKKLPIPLTSRINKLTGRLGPSSPLCPISANSVASKLVKNGAHKSGGREPATRLSNKELFDLWKILRWGIQDFWPFRPEKLAATLIRLKPGKSSGLNSTFPEFILHARTALKSWFCSFLTSACANSKFQWSGEEH